MLRTLSSGADLTIHLHPAIGIRMNRVASPHPYVHSQRAEGQHYLYFVFNVIIFECAQ